MNKKISKITTWIAVAVFLFALVINVKVTLDDPFVLLSDTAVATESSYPCPGYNGQWFCGWTGYVCAQVQGCGPVCYGGC